MRTKLVVSLVVALLYFPLGAAYYSATKLRTYLPAPAAPNQVSDPTSSLSPQTFAFVDNALQDIKREVLVSCGGMSRGYR